MHFFSSLSLSVSVLWRADRYKRRDMKVGTAIKNERNGTRDGENKDARALCLFDLHVSGLR